VARLDLKLTGSKLSTVPATVIIRTTLVWNAPPGVSGGGEAGGGGTVGDGGGGVGDGGGNGDGGGGDGGGNGNGDGDGGNGDGDGGNGDGGGGLGDAGARPTMLLAVSFEPLRSALARVASVKSMVEVP
jgi:hypothetical protein